MMWKVLVSAPYILPVIEEYRQELEGNGIQLIIADVNERLSENELLPLVKDIHGTICGDDQYTKTVLDSAPNLKVISKWGTGIDSIDCVVAGSKGIKVCNTPGAFTDPVADTVMGYVLLFARGLLQLNKNVKSGQWQKYQGVSLNECSIGVVGLGDVGKAVVKRATAFGMDVFGTDIRDISDGSIESAVKIVGLDELLASSDYVTLNCTLSESSYHLMSSRELGLMRKTAYLINTCRGPVVDEIALSRALDNKLIAGAALDVFEDEPLSLNNPLLSMDNCLLAPHNANSSPSAWERVHRNTIRNLLEGLQEG